MSFSFYRSVTIDKTKVGETDANFAVLLNLTTAGSGIISDLKTVANAGDIQNTCTGGAGGSITIPADLVFRTSVDLSDAGTNIPHEVEYYDATTGALVVHVKCGVNTASDVVIYMVYGNSAITTNQEQITSVWDANFKLVWHFAQSSNPILDSTVNNNNGTIFSSPSFVDGNIGKARQFDGLDDYIEKASPANFPTGTAQRTMSMWFKQPVSEYNVELGGYGYNLSTGDRFAFAILNAANRIYIECRSIAAYCTWTYDSNWHFLVAVLPANKTKATEILLYLDGVQQSTTPDPEGTLATVAFAVAVGRIPNVAGYYFEGMIDEFRVESVARSAEYIATTFNNQSNPATFYTLGGEPGPLAQPYSFIM